MRTSEKYINIWINKKESIYKKLLISSKKQSIQLKKIDFENVGNRIISEYSFNLEFKNGVVYNDISGTAVARDLAKVLLNSTKINELLKEGCYKINMDRQFCLWINKL